MDNNTTPSDDLTFDVFGSASIPADATPVPPIVSTLPNPDLSAVNPYNVEAMKPHVEYMQKLIADAAADPKNFSYAVVVIGTDGLGSVVHGTATETNIAASMIAGLDNDSAATLVAAISSFGPDTVAGALAREPRRTYDRAVAAGVDFTTSDGAQLDGGTSVFATEDLNGDGVIDQADHEIARQRLADDGCPHCDD